VTQKRKPADKPTDRVVSLTARVPYKLYERLHLIRLREHREMLDILREAIELFLEKHS
jgi:predicted DNA-binding protein